MVLLALAISANSYAQNSSIFETPYGINRSAKAIDVLVKDHGMADAHAWVEGDTLWIGVGHDESPNPHKTFSMDRWEIWSTKDLEKWTYHTSMLPADTYMTDLTGCFAGDITSRNGKYYWVFSDRTRSTGVMVAERPEGPYKDLLGKPLITTKNGFASHPYDPEIFIEDGVYTICYGSGTYYMATLAEDMKSMTTVPKKIIVQNEQGEEVKASDKSTLFKRNGWYYLVYGSRYAMSRELYGPYKFMGAFLSGGHTSFFEWDNQLYVLQENHDTSALYRGISLKPVFFNKDDSIIVPKDDRMYPAPGRQWDFTDNAKAWTAANGTTLAHTSKGAIEGRVSAKGATIASAAWLFTLSEVCSEITIKIKNNSDATELKLTLDSRDEGRGFWNSNGGEKDWSTMSWVTIPIKPNSDKYRSYTVSLDQFADVKERIMQLAIQPAADAASGEWSIDEIIIH